MLATAGNISLTENKPPSATIQRAENKTKWNQPSNSVFASEKFYNNIDYNFENLTLSNRLNSVIQPKLKINRPGDRYEQEADRIAEQVMRMQNIPSDNISSGKDSIQRKCYDSSCDGATCPKCAEEDQMLNANLSIQRFDFRDVNDKARNKTLADPKKIVNYITPQNLSSGGQRMGGDMLDFFESRFNRDLSGVRIHSGPFANKYCQKLEAHAFTYGNHIWLGKDLQNSASFVLAHEITHVIQQTQPNELKKGRRNVGVPKSRSPNHVQRLPFWVPINTSKGKLMSGADIHKELLDEINGKKKVEIEAPVPNAIRNAVGLDLQGFADLYRASSRVGVFFKPGQGVEVGAYSGSSHPAKPDRAGKDPKPVLNPTGEIDEIKAGPNKIELGELKPAAKDELRKGHDQLKHYEEGFKLAAKLTNEWAANKKIQDKWDLKSIPRLGLNDVTIAEKHKPGSPSATVRHLALADIDEVSPKGGKEGVKYSVKKVFIPKHYLGQDIPGKLYMEHFGQGLWMYYAQPDDFSKALDVPKFKREEKQAYMKVANAVQDEVIGNLKRGPKRIMFFKRGRRTNTNTPYIKPTQATTNIFRKPKNYKLKDNFDNKAHKQWIKRQSELGKEVRGKAMSSQGTKKAFKKLEFLDLAAKAENAITSKVSKRTTNFPTPAQLKEQIVTGTGTTKVIKKTSLDKIFSWLERWTSPAYKILGQFRLRFGSVFVTAVNKFSKIKKSIVQKTQKFFKNHHKAKKAGKLLFKALSMATKQVLNIVVPHTLKLVMKAITTGINKKLEALFEDSFLDKGIDRFKTWWENIKDYGNKAVEKVKNLFLQKFDWVKPLLDKVKWFWRIIKAGRVLLKCRKPPFLGCLRLLKSAAKDNELNCILCIPWVQKQIGKRVMAVPWFNNIPVKLGNLILETLKDAVPDKAKILKDIFDEKIPGQKADIGDLVPECDAQCSGFGFFKGGGGQVSDNDAKAAEKMVELNDKLSKQQVEDLLKEAEQRGMLDKPFDQKKAEEILKDLEQKKKEQDADKNKKEEEQRENRDKRTADDPQAPKQPIQEQSKEQKQFDRPKPPNPEKQEGRKPQRKLDKPRAPRQQAKQRKANKPGRSTARKKPVQAKKPWSGADLGIGVHVDLREGHNVLRYNNLARLDGVASGTAKGKFSGSIKGKYCRGMGFDLVISYRAVKDGLRLRPAGYPLPILSANVLLDNKSIFNKSGRAVKEKVEQSNFKPPFGRQYYGLVSIPIYSDKIKEGKNLIKLKLTLDDRSATNSILILEGNIEYSPHPVPTCT